MPSILAWEKAQSPNYGPDGSEDKIFPYSEVPYIGKYKLVKIPQGSSLIDLVDYWGEGRINSEEGKTGYSDCYNVNHPYQCVSNGSDRGRKIPNRVPVWSYTVCDTSSYIKEGSVRTVTLMGAPINKSCAADIARIINKNTGKVVVFGFNKTSADIKNLERELDTFDFIHCADYYLPDQLKGVTLFDTMKNVTLIRTEIREHIVSGNFDSAVGLSKVVSFSSYSDTLTELVNELLQMNDRNLISFAYKLWNSDGQEVVSRHFHEVFRHIDGFRNKVCILAFTTFVAEAVDIFKEDIVTIVNKKNNLPLKLAYEYDSYNDRRAWGSGTKDKASKRLDWKLIPVWKNNKVRFGLQNIDGGMFLKLVTYTDSIGDREAWGGYNFDVDKYRWYLDPVMWNGELLFSIVNVEYGLGLKLALRENNIGDRQLWGHNADVHGDPEKFGWYIKARNY